ncbi:DUF4276 family protein [Xylophilus sp. GOD-11R]|uniref:DUF4276 family protein n=1 Tax=Xylophilus sp. GOD-11R TaxID=3089814 RepID=UPI00298BE13C|nr:DUF4276 family protein [Xylophilus sp. GOD-11R]WPB56247.1 DUF4276 family protein [Xylophilus sp. GOD-11R]
MITVVPIVEGDGEVIALPILLRRISDKLTPEISALISPPIRVQKDRFLNKPLEFRRHLLLAGAKAGGNGWILILLDADDDCPVKRGAEIASMASNILRHRSISVVMANREYEAWFIAAAKSLDGHRNFILQRNQIPADPDRPRNAKGWLAQQMGGRGYNETTDQPAFSARLNLDEAISSSRSFRKLCDEWSRQTVKFYAKPN